MKTLMLVVAAAFLAAPCQAADGKAVYDAKCASCHGKDGKGNAGMGKMFKLEPAALDMTDEGTLGKSDADLIKITADGSGKMPAYKGKLSDEDLAAVVAYIRSLSGAPAAEAKPAEAKADGAAKADGEAKAAPAIDAAALYTAKCKACHAADAKGNAGMAKGFKLDAAALNLIDEPTLAKSDEDLLKLTSEGLNKMPAFKGKLSEDEIKAILAWLRAKK